MKKIKIKVRFRYDGEAVIDADDDWRMVFTRESEEEVKQQILEELNFDLSIDDEGTGAISDWNLEIEEVEA